MKIESPAFGHEQFIPQRHTCEGEDISPRLLISDVPAEAKALVLIVDDPDAPMGTFDHWIAWNIDPSLTEIPEGFIAPQQGTNGFGDQKYRGPCPPPGAPHRYFFKLYALDQMLTLASGSSKSAVEHTMADHVLVEAEWVGLYQR